MPNIFTFYGIDSASLTAGIFGIVSIMASPLATKPQAKLVMNILLSAFIISAGVSA